jgi:hypothetical protein
MGVTCACQKIESEEETIGRILSCMSLNEVGVNSAYSEFQKCISKDEDVIEFFSFEAFLAKILGENNYKSAQLTYFTNLRKLEHKKQNIRRIGAMIIYLSKGTHYQKVEALHKHYLQYYNRFEEKTVKEFIVDLIDCNTEMCLQSFKENIGNEGVKMLNEIWKKQRKRKLILEIYKNYDNVKIKYFHRSPQQLAIGKVEGGDKLNTSIIEEEPVDSKNNSRNLSPNIIATQRDDICDGYEKYNKSQNDHFYLKTYVHMDSGKNMNDDEKIIRDFIELSFNQLGGEFIRNWLYEDYLKEKTYDNVCI